MIEEFGTCDIAGEEFLGLYRVPAMGGALLGSVSETIDAQTKYAMPPDMIAVMLDGMGGIVVLDATRTDRSGEYPVLVWTPEDVDRESMERIGDDFGSFALSRCHAAVSRWRGAA